MNGVLHPSPAVWADLALVRFRTETQLTDAMRQWRYDTPVMVAESCARQVWVGLRGDFDAFPFPPNNVNAVAYQTGADAYRFLLELVIGNDSPRPCESNIAGQFYEGWIRHQADHPALAARLHRIVQYLRTDSAMIRTNVVNHIRPARTEMAARTLSGLRRGEQALVIGHVSDGQAHAMTRELFKALASGRAGAITVTHPTTRGAIALEDTLAAMKDEGLIGEQVRTVRIPFNRLAGTIEHHQRIYCDIPMNTAPETDMVMMHAWKDRAGRGNTFTHLRGDPQRMGANGLHWRLEGLDNFISPDAIRAEMARLNQENARLRQQVGQLVAYCIDMRSRGQGPNWHKYSQLRA